jgi:hypothetical protein
MPLDRNARMAGGAPVGADRGDVPSRAAAAEEDVPDDRHDREDQDIGGNAEDAAAAEPIPKAAVA